MSRRATLGALAATAVAVSSLTAAGWHHAGHHPHQAHPVVSSQGEPAVPAVVRRPVTGPDSFFAVRREPATRTPAWTPYAHKPNVLLITSDDLSILDLPYMPHVRRLLEREGTTFSDAIATTPLCVPSRASLLSGQYAHNHGARSISGPHGGFAAFSEDDTVPEALQAAGYDTLLTGKFLNGYGVSDPTEVPPGWTDWRATDDPSTYDFFSPVINDNGTLEPEHAYTTDVMSEQADEMISAPQRHDKPWFAWVSYVAPHAGSPTEPGMTGWNVETTVPAPQDRTKYDGLTLKRPDLFTHGKGIPDDSPSIVWALPATDRGEAQTAFRLRVQAVQAVDRAVASQIKTLRRTHQLDNTIVIFGSDNGYVTGEHDLDGKLWGYNEIARIPLVMRGPGVPRDHVTDTTITTTDLATTIMQIAGAKPLRPQDGVGMMPWLDAPAQWRVVPLEGWGVTNGDDQAYRGLRFGPWTYLRYSHGGGEELYDRRTDPYEMHPLEHDPRYRHVLRTARALALQLATCAGSTCPKEFQAAP